MFVIFHDIDGVYNTYKTPTYERGGHLIAMDQEKVFLMNKFVDQHPEIKNVLSSAWRNHEDWRGEMQANGFVFEFYDKTPDFKGVTSRGSEIKAWLDQHPEVTKYAILDDATDFLDSQKPNWFRTYYSSGLTEETISWLEKHFYG